VRIAALGKIADKAIIAEIARMDKAPEVRRAAIGEIAEKSLLTEIAKNDKSPDVRKPLLLS